MSILIESATYTPNVYINSIIADTITGYSFRYDAKVIDDNGNVVETPIVVDMNEDDITTEETSNCIYCYLDSTKINYQLEKYSGSYEGLVFTKNHPKTWKSDKLLYLLKINKNSGIVYRYDIRLKRFTTQPLSWNSASPDAIIRDVLIKDYLESYFQEELSQLETTQELD